MKDSKVLGIIAEYNPFHNGHAYQIEMAKELSGAESVVAVISGNFTQRGNTSVVNKWQKTKMALENGVDLVIELPTVYSVSSSENFARGAIGILNELGVVDAISFGTETEDFAALNNIASVLSKETKKYKELLAEELKRGNSYPKARENALMLYLDDNKRYSNILNGSNNILAIEYLKALRQSKSTIQPIIVKRSKVYYNDDKIVDDFASATAIRKMLVNMDFSGIRKVVPMETYKTLIKEAEIGNVVPDLKIYQREIIYLLRRMSVQEIENLPDVSEGLEHNIKNAANLCSDLESLINLIKTKRYTRTRIQRILLSALLGITKKDIAQSKKIMPYVRVLGFNEAGKTLVSRISKNVPKNHIITSLKKFEDSNNSKVLKRMIEIDKFASDVYTTACKNEMLANLDYTRGLVKI